MKLIFRQGNVDVSMGDYLQEMIEEFLTKLKSTDTALIPANDRLSKIMNSKPLDKKKAKNFNSLVAKPKAYILQNKQEQIYMLQY